MPFAWKSLQYILTVLYYDTTYNIHVESGGNNQHKSSTHKALYVKKCFKPDSSCSELDCWGWMTGVGFLGVCLRHIIQIDSRTPPGSYPIIFMFKWWSTTPWRRMEEWINRSSYLISVLVESEWLSLRPRRSTQGQKAPVPTGWVPQPVWSSLRAIAVQAEKNALYIKQNCSFWNYSVNMNISVRFEVFTAVSKKNGVFLDVTQGGSCKNRRFGGT
jgi:hypothetical protein